MASLNAVNIHKGKLGPNTLGSSDGISGIIIGASAPSSLALDTPTVIYNLKGAIDLGITQDYDDANKVNVHRHIAEFYRNAQEGTELYLTIVAQSTTMSSICQVQAKRLLAYAKGKVRQLAIAINPVDGASITMLDGIPNDVNQAIAKAQGLALWAYDNNMPCQVFLEGYSYGGNASSTLDLRAIPNLPATKVSVFIGQDYNYAKTRVETAQKYADVGTLLGVCSLAKVNENVGNNEKFNITEAVKDAWLEPGLSSHTPNDEVFEDLQILENKGFLFGVEYAGQAGVRINNDHTCTPIVIDADNRLNEHTIAYGRVMDKAVRELRSAYLPKVKTDWPIDPATGKLPPGIVVALEDVGNKVFGDMQKRGEITLGKTYVDASSDLVIAKELIVTYDIIPKGSIGEIKGTIYLKTQV